MKANMIRKDEKGLVMKTKKFVVRIAAIILIFFSALNAQSYKIADTGQKKFYNNNYEISAPSNGSEFYGQDAQYIKNDPSFTDNGDGTITDNVTGLMWQKSADLNGDGTINIDDKLTYEDALNGADSFNLAGYSDWRLPTIKELYSLIDFNGIDPSGWNGTDVSQLTPFINTKYFDFGYGDENAGERIIDAQFATTTLYVGSAMNSDQIMFGVNFADGRIKGYPYGIMPGRGEAKTFYVLYVRGNNDYGKNDFVDNGDGTITDKSTGLMWSQYDNGEGITWEEALNWVEQKNSEKYLGYSDWRLPNVKELQSIVDYSRSPQTTNSAAIDPLFNSTSIIDEGGSKNYPFYWSSTTHTNMMNGNNAAYVAFGEALGWMQDPYGNYQLMDVHGAGAQRSDPKTGDPSNYPYGHGPQGDVIRIYNYVRIVRDLDEATSIGDNSDSSVPDGFVLEQNYPNPFNPSTTIKYSIPVETGHAPSLQDVTLKVYDMLGREITTLVDEAKSPGTYEVTFDASKLSSGVYLYKLQSGSFNQTKKLLLLK